MVSISLSPLWGKYGAEVDPWLGCHGYLLPIASFADHLIGLLAPTVYPPMKYWQINAILQIFQTSIFTGPLFYCSF